MSFRRYVAGTVREALDRVRRELGEDAVILSNKRLGTGRIEIVAAASDSMQALVEDADRPHALRATSAAREPRADGRVPTESFQDYVRRQMPSSALRASEGKPSFTPRAAARSSASAVRADAGSPSVARSAEEGVAMYHEVAGARAEPEAMPAHRPASVAAPVRPASAPAVFRQRAEPAPPARPISAETAPPERRSAESAVHPTIAGPASPAPLTESAIRPSAPPAPAAAALIAPAPRPAPLPAMATVDEAAEPTAAKPAQAAAAVPAVDRDDSRVMAELRSLRAALSDRIAALESNIASRTPPAQRDAVPQRTATTRVMTRLLMSGFSPELARRIAIHVPATGDIAATDHWLHEVVAGNLRCASGTDGLIESHGAVALVGPTGVGKTTTVAKLAARFAVRYGAAQLALITLDSYRIGAHEQLRSYGRILGVPMHIAQDGATLRELLASLQGKRLVLIDTCGLSQRDERMEEMLGTLSAARFNMQPIRRVLLLNAASHCDTLDEVARAWHAPDAAGAILTKMDEAARIGGAVDCLLRYRMMMFGLTNGQRVPEDWHPAGARLIAHVSLKPSMSPYTIGEDEAQAWTEQPQGSVHA